MLAVYSKLKISHHKHSGKLRPHEHTSYLPLLVMVVMVGVLLISTSISTVSASDPPPQAGSVGLTGIMPAAPPKVAATIGSPKNNQHFTDTPITVSGTCPTNTLVEIYKNDIFAGSVPCATNGTYSTQVDLLYGQNTLTARVYDSLNQAGPISNSVVVYYDSSAPQTAPISFLNFSGAQLLIITDAVYRGTFPGQLLNVPITILGGTAPFAVNVEWGDSSNKVIPRSDNSIFNASHIYQKPGTYTITIQASDSSKQVAFLSVAAIVNGQPSIVGTAGSTKPKPPVNKLLVLWPLYAILITMIVSFWLGEYREKRVLLHTALTPEQTGFGIVPKPTV